MLLLNRLVSNWHLILLKYFSIVIFFNSKVIWRPFNIKSGVEKYNLYPNLDYCDGSGNITYFCDQSKHKYKLLLDSHSRQDLKRNHLLNLKNGEQIHSPSGLPIFYHFARGGSRDTTYKKAWVKEAKAYLE